ncbi:Aldo/keto reductase [Auricularia subglabra TFB-10046 SS5]|nr:Aldo/keto reductase [Auricularia subglabra TFB-10046 SS5]
MAVKQTSELNIVMGAMTFGEAGKDQARVTDPAEVAKILDIFTSHGHKEVDTARLYAWGTSEEMLAKANWKGRGILMETKLYPSALFNIPNGAHHTPEDIRKHMRESLKALNTEKVYMWYLHGPDRSVPYEVTLKAVDDLYKEGLFEHFGVSNYAAWEVAQIYEICAAKGYVKPIVYQGIYNAIHRAVEPELFPCLRHYGLAFYAFNPLGGGFFTGHYEKDAPVEPGSRFDPETRQGAAYRVRYWNDTYFNALEIVRPVSDKHGLTLTEVALRWMSHHSLLKRKFGDAVIIGASSTKHIEQNLVDLEKGLLPEDVVKALDEAWGLVQAKAGKYFH